MGPSGVRFPEVRELDGFEVKTLRDRLVEKLCLPPNVDGLEVVTLFDRVQRYAATLSQEEPGFDLMAAGHSLGIKWPKSLYLNWYRFDAVERMSTSDIARYFDYIWYPGPDDLDLFDDSLSWIVTVTHGSTVQAVRF